MSVLTVERDTARRVATVTLNRPHRGNALDDELHAELRRAWRHLAGDAEIDGVVLTAAGSRWFCTGRDVKELAAAQQSGRELARDEAGALATGRKGFIPPSFPKPVLLALNGSVVGGGWAFVADADLAFATPTVRLLDGHAQAGQFGGFHRIYHSLPRKIAVELMLTDRSLSAEEGVAFGLINRIVDADELLDQAVMTMASITQLSASARAAYMDALRAMRQHEEDPLLQGFLRLQARQTRQSKASQDAVRERFGEQADRA